MITEDATPDTQWLDGLERVLRDDSLDPAYRALMMGIPSQAELARVLFERGHTPDPQAIWSAAETLAQFRAERWADLLPRLAGEATVDAPYSPEAEQVGKRALGAAVLALQTRLDGGSAAQAQFEGADNMTLQLTALGNLVRAGRDAEALAAFEAQWKDDRLVMDKWFGLQIGAAAPDLAVERAQALTEHPAFDWKNPNRFRAVLGALAMHHAAFHRADGAAYDLLADWLIRLDDLNPQTTARMAAVFQTWTRYDEDRRAKMRAALERIAAKPRLSSDTGEMVERMLAQ
jgi:aminopeptidase N